MLEQNRRALIKRSDEAEHINENIDFSSMFATSTHKNQFQSISNPRDDEIKYEYGLNYNPYKTRDSNSYDPGTLRALKKMALSSDINSLQSPILEETFHSPDSTKKGIKFFNSLRSKKKAKNPMLIKNPLHFFKVNVCDFDEFGNVRKGIIYPYL